MPIIKAPQYSKVPHATTGNIEPCYTFAIESTANDKKLAFIAENAADLSLVSLQSVIQEQEDTWSQLIQTFLQTSAKLFSKPYTIAHINKIAKHAMNGTDPDTFPVHVTAYPSVIQIRGGVFWVHWSYTTEPMLIDIPDLEADTTAPLPVSSIEDGVQELSLDDLPVEKNATEVPLTLDPPTKFYDRQRVKEARLKAKLAVYRAQHQLHRYYEKYGTELSDSDTESDSNSDSEKEEVQL